jgi:Rrf2 family transcriptional regulator, iron-sulfur cluster assembly transcription factor
MKITAQEEYGLRCLLRLSEAEGDSLTLPDLAAAEGLSIPYVAKLMGVLKQSGLVDSERGRTGGYRLSRPPAEIGLGSLLLQLGEPLFDEPGYCQKHAGQAEDGVCVHNGACSLRALWQTLESWMRGTLNQITLADLLQNEGQITEMLRSKLAGTVFEDTVPLLTLSLRK